MDGSLHIVCPHCDSVNRVPVERLAAGGKCGRCGQVLLNGEPLELHHGNFDQHISRNDLPVLVDFWAPWCGPCKMMAPVFVQVAQQMQHKVRLLKVNTEAEQALAARYQIRSIPTLALFMGGVEVDRLAGAVDQSSLVAWLEQRIRA